MQTMTPATLALLKSKLMIGQNAFSHKVTISGGDRSFDGRVKIIQGQGTTGKDVSNWAETTDGRYMCCWFDSSTKQLQTGYSADLDFVTTDYAIESALTTAAITVDTVDTGQASLYRRDDGKVLLLVSNNSNISWAKCYISNTGNGDDWAYLSTIHQTTSQPNVSTDPANMNIPVVTATATGNLLITFVCGHDDYAGYIFTGLWAAISSNEGQAWTKGRVGDTSVGYGPDSIGQPCVLSDGTVFCCNYVSSGHSYIQQSNDNGQTWVEVADFYNDFSDTLRDSVQGLSFYYDEGSNTVYGLSICTLSGCGIYRLQNPTAATFLDKSAWEFLYDVANNMWLSGGDIYYISDYLAFQGHDGTYMWIVGIPPGSKELPAKSISISRSKGIVTAAGLSVLADNKNGIYSPDRVGEWYQVIWPNAEIMVEQGYGTDLVQTFKGLIDSPDMTTFPQQITVSARDMLKKALDQTVTGSTGNHVLTYTNSTVESIFISLCTFAGIAYGTVEATGLTIVRKEFSWESFADAMQWLAELVGFEVVADELGIVHFRRDWYPDTGVSVYTFQEGVDIINLGYKIDDRDLYNKVVVHGRDVDGNVIEYAANVPGADYWRLPAHKILKLDASECDTLAKLQTIAERAIYLMMSRFRRTRFLAIGVPGLQIGDLVNVIESSTTISEVYRVTDFNSDMDEKTYTMDITAHWYSHGGS